MKIYLINSLCKKCPYSAFKKCHYKETFYKKIPKAESNLKLVHKCKHYKNIFKKGQYVLVDLHDRVRQPDGRWKYTLAYKDVPGLIKGNRGCKFIIELIEPHFLLRKKFGTPYTETFRVHLECSRIAKDIRPFVADHRLIYSTKSIITMDLKLKDCQN